jgi:hypothetical protein
MSHEALLPCPFCGRPVDDDLDDGCNDTLYPSGIYWREEHGMRHYVSHRERQEGDQPCWSMHCPTTGGGCDVEVTADSKSEVIAKWNRRAPDAAVRESRDLPHEVLRWIEHDLRIAQEPGRAEAAEGALVVALRVLRELNDAVTALATEFDKPITDENIGKWLALNDAGRRAQEVCRTVPESFYTHPAGMDAARAKAIEDCCDAVMKSNWLNATYRRQIVTDIRDRLATKESR